jgi:hypothetical protein
MCKKTGNIRRCARPGSDPAENTDQLCLLSPWGLIMLIVVLCRQHEYQFDAHKRCWVLINTRHTRIVIVHHQLNTRVIGWTFLNGLILLRKPLTMEIKYYLSLRDLYHLEQTSWILWGWYYHCRSVQGFVLQWGMAWQGGRRDVQCRSGGSGVLPQKNCWPKSRRSDFLASESEYSVPKIWNRKCERNVKNFISHKSFFYCHSQVLLAMATVASGKRKPCLLAQNPAFVFIHFEPTWYWSKFDQNHVGSC